jgi:hypothetical protein
VLVPEVKKEPFENLKKGLITDDEKDLINKILANRYKKEDNRK